MAKIDFTLVDVPRDERLHTTLAKDPYVSAWMMENDVSMDLIKDNAYTIQDVLRQRRPCTECNGLSECRQKTKGYRLGLKYDVFLSCALEACPFEDRYEEEHAHLKKYLINDLGERMSTVAFEKIDLRAKENTGVVYSEVLASCFKACSNGESVYLYGPMGTGKTYLAACCANAMARSGKSVSFVHAPKFFNKVMDQLASGEYRTMEQRCCYCDLLVLDDLGAEEVTDKTRSVLLSILDHRMQNGKMTWITSNADEKVLLNHYLVTYRGENRLQAERILERIRTICVPIALTGKDRRHLSLHDK